MSRNSSSAPTTPDTASSWSSRQLWFRRRKSRFRTGVFGDATSAIVEVRRFPAARCSDRCRTTAFPGWPWRFRASRQGLTGGTIKITDPGLKFRPSKGRSPGRRSRFSDRSTPSARSLNWQLAAMAGLSKGIYFDHVKNIEKIDPQFGTVDFHEDDIIQSSARRVPVSSVAA